MTLAEQVKARLAELLEGTTPGPWQTRFIYRLLKRVRESPGDLLIGGKTEDDWKDAKLMASAPELVNLTSLLVDRALRHTAACGVNHPEPMKYNIGYSPRPCDCGLPDVSQQVRELMGLRD